MYVFVLQASSTSWY